MGTITCSRGAYRAFWSDQGLVNTGVSKTVFYGMEEVVGSIPTRSTNKLNNLADTLSSSLAAFWQQIFNGLQKLLRSF
ncbi:MAG: hypothetical protein P4L50_00720, partial [Anaerolineaceae bacterium]|nr:hypothetical protein [Anaerolineaceae bacterium]